MSYRMLPLVAVLALPFTARPAGDAALDRATLRGLTSLSVVVDPLDIPLVRQGVTPEMLRERIERGLQAARIKLDPNAKEFLGVRVTQVRASKGPFAVCLNAGVYQPVLLARDQKMRTATQTWEVETVVLADPKQLHEAMIASLDELADRFVAAWKSVNPQLL